MQNGIPLSAEQQLALIEQHGGLEAWGTEIMAPALRGGLGVGGQLPVPMGQAGRLPPRRHAQPDGRAAGRAASPTRAVCAASSRTSSTSAPTILEVAGIPAPGRDRRHRADADPRHQLRSTASTTATRPSATPSSTSRSSATARMYKDGWLASLDAAAHPVGRSTPATMSELRARRLEPRHRPRRAVLPARRLLPGAQPRGRPPREGRRAAGAVLGGGREVPRPAAARRVGVLLRHRAAARRAQPTFMYHGVVQNVASGMIPRIYNHSYTISADLEIPPRRRRRGDRRRGRSPRRLLAVRQGRDAAPHLLAAWASASTARSRDAAADRQRQRPAGVRRRRRHGRQRAAR